MKKKSFFSLIMGLQLVVLINSKRLRIVEGEYALPGQFPHQVSIQAMTPDNCTQHVCGGSIIDERHILTASHCVTEELFREFLDIPWTIVAGTVDLKDRSSGVYRDVETIFIPNSYIFNDYGDYNDDIAILKLREALPLDFHEYLNAVNLPDSKQYLPPDNRTAVISGFGAYNQTALSNGSLVTGPMSQFLRFVHGMINVDNQEDCLDSEICVRSPRYQEGDCYGDSGGPLYDEDNNTLIGIVSHSDHESCGDTSKYTRVSAHLDFIYNVLTENIDDTIVWHGQSHKHSLEYPNLTVCDI
ncbi:hypothetical protein TKK_0010669 [Trichogramma kaykai]|uniref:Peptidase S1 domain-containing protein n=1 Tax=Trichogramma kaykai TaxID=54128 RepID=A0ABD2WX13_9HYME